MMNPTAQELASKGRYGDSMLVHMNPEEVAGIASLAPGQMTINPETGLPEAFKFRDFLRFALPIAGSIALPAMAPTLAGSSVFAKAALSGVGSGLGTLLAGGNTDEALTSGLTAGLTYGLGSKLAGAGKAVPSGVEGGTEVVNQQLTDAVTRSSEFPIGLASQNAPPINPSGAVITNPAAVANPVDIVDKSRTASLLDKARIAESKIGIKDFLPKDATGRNINYGDTLGLGGAGALGAYASTPIEEEPEEEYGISLAEPWRRKYRRKPPGYVGEFQYFDPSGIYGASGGYVNKMQEGGEVDPTSPVEDDSLGLMAYAPLIANYPSYDTGLGALPEYNPTPMQPTMRTDMGEKDYGVAPVAVGSGGIGSREPRFGFDSFDDRKAPEGFMYTLVNPPGSTGRMDMSEPSEYRLMPTKNLSALEMEDLTRRGILIPYRPEGARYIDYQPQVEQTEGTRGGEYGPPIGMQEGGLTTISEGMVSGAGDGMSDNVYGTIDNMQKVALSEGEFIIPADVVSGIGNGSSESGAERLYDMMDRIRKARTGTMQQAPAIDVSVMMPA